MSSPDDICQGLPPCQRGLSRRRRRYQMLKMWYGQERADFEIAAHTCQVKEFNTLLDNVLIRMNRPESGIVIQLHNQWEKIVGSMFARFTEPEALRDGVLMLKVRHSALLVELKPSCDLIRRRINEISGKEVCREIRLCV
ncbi:MAG: DUF721 domain-containing protein [Lentisphaeria bacterium]|nr:DUF721 domain-containing protein [Lentisphaeria bacterium]